MQSSFKSLTRILKALRHARESLGSDLIVEGWVRAANATRWDEARPAGGETNASRILPINRPSLARRLTATDDRETIDR